MAKHGKQSDAGDIENGQGRRELEERIRFEELLCDLSATFVNLLYVFSKNETNLPLN